MYNSCRHYESDDLVWTVELNTFLDLYVIIHNDYGSNFNDIFLYHIFLVTRTLNIYLKEN